MSKVKVLFFAADPLSAPPDGRARRLLLDEDVRQIRSKVRAAEHRDALEFDVRWAARTDDLLQALNEAPPQVVHFSGHGGNEGLVLVGADGRGAHYVDAAALAQLFQVFRGDIRLAVLNACFSLPQAQAIAEAVGCAIGTRGEISDGAAITFGASFYRALAFGQSVQAAYDQARAALALEHFEDRECPQLVARPGVDPARLVLVSPAGVEAKRRGMGRMGTAVAGVAVAGAAVVASLTLGDRLPPSPEAPAADSVPAEAPGTVVNSLLTADSAPATAPAREPVATQSGDGGGSSAAARRPAEEGRRPAVDTRPVDAEKSAAAVEGPVSAPVVHKITPLEDTFAFLRDTPRTRNPR